MRSTWMELVEDASGGAPNPLADAMADEKLKGTTDDDWVIEDTAEEMREELANTNAVVSPLPKETLLLGRILQTPLYRVVQGSILLLAPYFLVFGQDGDFKSWGVKPTTLGAITYLTLAAAIAASLLPLAAVRRVLAQDGELQQLGAGTVMISHADFRSLRRWQVCMGVISALVGTMMHLSFFWANLLKLVVGRRDLFGSKEELSDADIQFAEASFSDRLLAQSKWILIGAVGSAMVPLMMMGFYYSLRLGSAVVRDAVTEVIRAARDCDPTDKKRWQVEVVQPAIGLHKCMQTLSRGWGPGFLGLGLSCWLMALGYFSKAINKPRSDMVMIANNQPPNLDRNFQIGNTVIWSLLPLLLALDVAKTSTRCDQLMDQLNAVRIKYLNAPYDVEERVGRLETALMRLHRGQGLGFTCAGVVIDTKFLKNLFIAIVGSMTTVITILLSLTEEANVYDDDLVDVCVLTDVEIGTIRHLLAERNDTICRYNMTLESIIEQDTVNLLCD